MRVQETEILASSLMERQEGAPPRAIFESWGFPPLPRTDHKSCPPSVRCPSPPIPVVCTSNAWGNRFDYIEETLTKDWAGFRTELSRLGITPTASYTAQLLGNPIGGQSQGFTYAGTLEASINWDLHRLLGIPGLSFNIGGAWSTGRNLRPIISETRLRFRARTPRRVTARIISPWGRCICSSNCLATHS